MNQPYRKMKITGDVSIEPAITKVPAESWRYLVMGPTGAGKSSFIEGIAGDSQRLSISKDQLGGYTQKITAYKVVNAFRFNSTRKTDEPMYLIDTPGFSDTRISEIEIINMIIKWLKDNDLPNFDMILYCTPITSTRLAGTDRRTISLLKEFIRAPSDELSSTIIVTTMWDQLCNERVRQRAEDNFEQFCEDIFKDFLDEAANIAKFMNTRDSALKILELIWVNDRFFEESARPTSSPLLYDDLYQRIENGMRTKRNLEIELMDPDTQGNEELISILEQNYQETDELLTKFLGQLQEFGPLPPGYEKAHQHLQAAISDMTSQASYTEHPPDFRFTESQGGESALGVSRSTKGNLLRRLMRFTRREMNGRRKNSYF